MSEISDTDKSDKNESADAEMAATVEAILFSTDAPITVAKILQVAELPSKREVVRAIENLNARYEALGAAFRIENIAGGYRFQTLEAYHDVLSRLFKAKSESKLSQPAMETLSIVAYRQPVLRADIEAIRGVACGEVLRGLMEKLLIKIVGRAEVIGRPMLYGTTRRFLEVFGLASLSDLPRADELRQPPKKADGNGSISNNQHGISNNQVNDNGDEPVEAAEAAPEPVE
jgi:segregation and condensation protein B